MSYQNNGGYQRGGYGGGGRGGNQTPKKYIQVGALWSDENKDGNWVGKGTVQRDVPENPWIADLLLNPNTKLQVFPNDYKRGERDPDFRVVLVVPEDELPQGYWDWEQAKAQANQDRQQEAPRGPAPRQQGGYGQRQAPPQRGGYQDRQAPAPRDSYAGAPPNRGGSVGGYPARGGQAPRGAAPTRDYGRGRQMPEYQDDPNLPDPFDE